LLLKLHDGIVITLHDFIYFPRQCVILLEHNIVIFFHVLIVFPLRPEHVCVLVIVAMNLILEHLIKISVRVIVLKWGPYFLVALVSLFPLPHLLNHTSSRVLILRLGVIFLLNDRFVSHRHSFH
jgi:hypothetical protein